MNTPRTATSHRASWWAAALLIRGQTEADQRNIGIFTVWCLVCAVGICAVAYVLKANPQLQGPLAWAVALIPAALGAAAVRAFLRLLREADEFMRKVQLEGIAMGFGAGSLFCIGYHFLQQVGAPAIPVVLVIVPLVFGWSIGSLLVAARYR